MLSDFIVNHPKLPLFTLTNKENEQAVKKEPWLNDKSDMNFLNKYEN